MEKKLILSLGLLFAGFGIFASDGGHDTDAFMLQQGNLESALKLAELNLKKVELNLKKEKIDMYKKNRLENLEIAASFVQLKERKRDPYSLKFTEDLKNLVMSFEMKSRPGDTKKTLNVTVAHRFFQD